MNGWPDRRHAAAVAREFKKARDRARELADSLWAELNPENTESENTESENTDGTEN